LFGMELELLREFNANALGFQKLDHFCAVFHLWTRRVTQGEPGSAVFHPKNVGKFCRVFPTKTPFGANL